ncbi:MAG: electron transfer flavoprotein subunit alpha/FixB family protein [Bacteroidia bacterium]|nr:electron transfer flavoprotein subunit alpha/FixB family protein [Bacteroidia bacterium]
MVLVYAENQDGKIKKSAHEIVTFGYKTAQSMGTECVALVIGNVVDAASLGKYGASKVIQVNSSQLESFDSQAYAQAISEVAGQVGAKLVVLTHNYSGKALLGRLGVKLNAGVVSGVIQLPETEGGNFKVRKVVFSGKAFAEYEINSDIKVISLAGNSLKPEIVAEDVEVSNLELSINDRKVEVIEVNIQAGDVAPLPEAELVVSAGRGMKGPENWNIIEELARELGATTACSRPVSDSGWRPHHEHVGQTGIAIKPNLYIAAGISGAIQHLAGVSSSKCIVVINKDPEAPFFKAADYGVCADLFDVVPKLTESLKKAKA